MPIYVATGTSAPGLKINGTDLSDHVKAVEVQTNTKDVDITAMGATAEQRSPGLRDDRIIVTFFQDFASSKVDATLNPLQGSSSGATVVAYANGTTASPTAPSYTCVMAPFDYSPINVAVGAASQTQVTFLPVQGSNGIQRGTS